MLVWSQDLSVQNWLNHLWITGRLGVRFGSISGGRWAGRFCGSVVQPQLLFSATWHSHFMPLTGEHMWCQKAREACVDGKKTGPYGSHVLIVSGVSGNAPQAPYVSFQGRRHLHFSKPWWLLKSLWPSQRLWTWGWYPNEMMVVMSIILTAGLVSIIWLAPWPEIISDSPKEERGKNSAGLPQTSHHSVFETEWTVWIISLSPKYQWLLSCTTESAAVCKRVILLRLPLLLLSSVVPPSWKPQWVSAVSSD